MDTVTLTTTIIWLQTSGVRIIFILVGVLVARVVLNAALSRFERAQGDPDGEDQRKRARTLGSVVRSLGTATIVIIGVLLILSELGVDTAPLLAGAGIMGLALGLGAQALVRDVIGGFFILAEEQFHVGDVVRIGEVTGTVERITLRASYLRDLEGALHLIPNGDVRSVANLTRGWSQAVVEVTVPNDREIGDALEVLEHVCAEAAEDPALSPMLVGAPEVTGVEGLDLKGARLRILARTQPGKQWEVGRSLRRRIKQELDAASELTRPLPREVVIYRGDMPTE